MLEELKVAMALVAVFALGWSPSGVAAGCPAAEPVPGGATLVTWVPSEAAPGRGIAVRLIWPERPRYPERTAAAVEVPGADSPGGVELPRDLERDPYLAQGLVRVSFAFPGGGRPPFRSGGVYDHRGLDSLRALRDVVRFLRGEIPDENGCYISDLLPYPLLQVGLIGLSNGGNTAVVALGLFGDEMRVDWYVGWENPAGVQFTTVDLGSRDQPLPFYSPCSCRLASGGVECDVDYTHLRWDGQAVSQGWGLQGRGTSGVLFHDLNGNGRYDEGDYVLGAYPGTFAGVEKRVYSEHALEAALERGLIDPWPEDVATLEEARDYWAIRDMSRFYAEVIENLPQLAAIVVGSEVDHVQATPDHPHILLQYQGWQAAGMPWVRLNPDSAYLQLLLPRSLPAVDVPAGAQIGCGEIAEMLEPEGIPDSLTTAAAALELSDRTYWGNWAPDLDEVLTGGTGAAPGASPAPGLLWLPHAVERLPGGGTLICDGSASSPAEGGPRGGRVLILDASGTVVWDHSAGLQFPHDAELDPSGERMLIVDTGHDRVIEVELSSGRVVWDSGGVALSDGSSLRYPNDADYLPDGTFLVTDRDNHRVVVLDREGRVRWQFGEAGVPGGDSRHLSGPHNADLLPDGNVIVADSGNDRVVEISPAGEIVWEYRGGLSWPRDADRLENGNTLITDSKNNRVIEVSPTGEVVWEYRGLQLPYEADRLPTGNTLIADSGGRRVLEVSPQGEVVWSFPPGGGAQSGEALLGGIRRESAWVLDEVGHRIYVAWWRPPGEGPFPTVVFVPSIGPGVPALAQEAFRELAADGFVVASFNPEGRGRPGVDRSEGEETCQGPNQQEDLKAVIEYLARLPYVDRGNIGVLSFSGGSLLAGPALGRWPGLPVAYWIDCEGPHDGSIILGEPCGHPNTRVDPSPENLAFWEERSPVLFIGDFRGRYLRVQAEIDHAQGDYREHALLMNNAAVEGGVPWVRINWEDLGNPVNRIYPLDDPSQWPKWIPGRLRDLPGGWHGVLAGYAREMAALVAAEGAAAAPPRFERASQAPVLGPGEDPWESVDVLSCEVLWDGEPQVFRMWYTGYDGERYAIGYAESHDGLRWERYPGNPVLASSGGEWDREGVGFPAVVRVGDMYYMYFTMLKRARAHRDAAVGLAVSGNGLHWEVVGPVLLPGTAGEYDARAAVSPDVFLDGDGTWHMFYAGGRDYPGDPDGRWVILHATSPDGVHWRADPEPVIEGEIVGMEDALNPELFRLPDGSFWLAFSARVEHAGFRLFLARSPDGLSWSVIPGVELLIPGEEGNFDEKSLNHPALVLRDEVLHLFYTGYNRRNRRAIGVAVAGLSGA